MVARRGVGLITSGNFYVPQVNLPGSMASFVAPAAIAVVAKSRGMGQTDATGVDVHQIASGGQLLPQSQCFGSTTPGYTLTPTTTMTNWLPWVICGGLLLVLMMGRR